MTGAEFVTAIEKLQTENDLTDNQVVSGLCGIIISLCVANGNDPVEFMRSAYEAARHLFPMKPQ